MAGPFGLLATGFNPMQQQDVIADLESAFQQQFGANINLSSESNFGQLIGILSGRFALLWQLGEAIYASQYPNGAEGTSVDNVLALNNLKRLPARATVTNPTPDVQSNGITLYGLLLFGTPGTVVPAGSVIQTTASPPFSFTLDNAVTIAAAVNAVQSVYFGNVPTQGSVSLALTDPAGNALAFPAIQYNALANQTQLVWGTATTTGTFKLVLTQAGVASTTGTLNWNDSAATIQAAIRVLTGYGAVSVSGSIAAGLVITWGAIANPIVTLTADTLDHDPTIADSVQASINNLHDTVAANYPYTDVTVAGSFAAGFTFTFGGSTPVGANPASGSQPQAFITVATNSLQVGTATSTTGNTVNGVNQITSLGSSTGIFVGMAVSGTGLPAGTTVLTTPSGAAITLSQNATASGTGVTFTFSATVTNVSVVGTTIGAKAQAVGSATCTATGTNFVAAKALSVIGSPVSGWASVTNQLDCVTGAAVETDTQALVRRSTLLAAQANGPLDAIVEKVLQVQNVTAAVGFQNLTGAALQTITFNSVPGSGNFKLSIGGQTTGSIAFNAAASDVQTALRALTGYSTVLVSGTVQFGFTVDFNGSLGSQAQPLMVVSSNTTGVTITVAFGRPPNSIEIVAAGGIDSAVAAAILASGPGGIKTYGTTTVQLKDQFNNLVNISFSRPQQVTFYATLILITDLFLTPGVPSSGANPLAKFQVGSIPTIQQDILTIGNAVPIGGLVVGFGSSGLIGAFNSVPGIVSYSLVFGTAANPSANANIQLLSEQQALFQQANIAVSYS